MALAELDPPSPEMQRPVALAGAPRCDPDLGYTHIPSPNERGFFSPEQLAHMPIAFVRGVGKAAIVLARHHLTDTAEHGWPYPERRIFRLGRHDRTALVTEPDPELAGQDGVTTTEFLVPGLGQIDMGSALLLHIAKARRHPDRRIATLANPSVSLFGRHLSIWEGFGRHLEETAADNLMLAREIADQDDPSHYEGVSLGSKIVVLMGALNLAAQGESQLNTSHVELISPAVGARDVPEEERFRSDDASEEELINDATNRFFKHMPGDTWRTFKRHPEKIGQCAADIGAYALAPHLLPNRMAAIVGNLRGAQEGVDWETVKDVARGYHVHVLGGELDPLVKEQISQWVAITKYAPATKFRVLGGYGHTLSVDGSLAAEHLAQMEEEGQADRPPILTLAA